MRGKLNSRGTIEERLDRYSIYEPNSGCRLWTGALSNRTYSSIWHLGRMRKAHVVCYEIEVGPVPPGLELDHLCRTKICIESGHLEPVTRSVNLARSPLMNRQAHKTHCPRGHAYEGPNLKLTKRGHRLCRTCQIEATRAWRASRAGR